MFQQFVSPPQRWINLVGTETGTIKSFVITRFIENGFITATKEIERIVRSIGNSLEYNINFPERVYPFTFITYAISLCRKRMGNQNFLHTPVWCFSKAFLTYEPESQA